MSATLKIYDPLKAAKRMQKAGVQKELAESIAEEIESQDCIINDLATKQDLEILKKDLIIKLGSIMAIGIGMIAVLIKF